MKRLMIVLGVLLVFSVSALAQMGGQKGEMGKGMMEQKSQIMMKQMMGQGGMMQGMMQMMMDMMNMQEKMMMGPNASDKKMMIKEMSMMKEKMQKMMSMHMGMMMGMGDSPARLKCAEGWLKKAIDLHELHMMDPKTTTESSQMELMDQIKKAYECVTVTGTPSKGHDGKETEKTEPPKTEEHKH
ncbi:MAG: hypothetical protein HZA11_09175 [Nitrospirae bacterium]|nr:hypothetical protein [Nitrospirota bacterium]